MNLSWRHYLSTIIELVLPSRCFSCQKSDYYLCPDCLALIPRAEPTEEPETEAVFHYQDPRIKRAIWRLKYQGGRAVARDLAQAIQEHWLEHLSEQQTWHPGGNNDWLVVPIPITTKRRRQRGFNQARELAHQLVRLDPTHLILTEDVLLKVRETPSQMKTRDRKLRLENLRGAFAVPKDQQEKVVGKNILLIDDVITTGATMQEARRALGAAGAREIFGLAIAHG